MFVAGWRHALRSEWPFIIIIIIKSMVFTSKKVSLRVKINVYSAMVLSVLLHGAAESWALSRTQLSRLETLHNNWLRCIIFA